jgi:hypothetical protein
LRGIFPDRELGLVRALYPVGNVRHS